MGSHGMYTMNISTAIFVLPTKSSAMLPLTGTVTENIGAKAVTVPNAHIYASVRQVGTK